jgi:hypothetical protein
MDYKVSMEFEEVGYIYFVILFLRLPGDAEGSHEREWLPTRLIIVPSPYGIDSRTVLLQPSVDGL